MPNSQSTLDTPQTDINTALQVATLVGKIDQFITNTGERLTKVENQIESVTKNAIDNERITRLETQMENRGKNWPAIVACISGLGALIVSVAVKVPWQ